MERLSSAYAAETGFVRFAMPKTLTVTGAENGQRIGHLVLQPMRGFQILQLGALRLM